MTGNPSLGRFPVRVDFDVPAAMPDGTRLLANVYRPVGPGPWPVLLARIPYRKDGQSADLGLDPVQVASRGYIVVLQDVRGRYTSDGDWEPFAQEARDGAASVAWAADLAGSNGRVGMFGASYLGYAQWAAAVEQPRALQAIAPRFAPIDAHGGLMARGGALELGLFAAWTLETGIEVVRREHAGDPAAATEATARLTDRIDQLASGGYEALPPHAFGRREPTPASPGFGSAAGTVLDRGAPDLISLVDRLASVSVPVLHVGGWYDIFLGDTLRAYRALAATGVEQRLLIGPWTHLEHGRPVGERSFGIASAEGSMNLAESIEDVQLAWFDRHLTGTGAARPLGAGAPVRIFVMGINRWRDEPEWPLRDTRFTSFYLSAKGRLDEVGPPAGTAPAAFDYDPADPVPTVGGSTLMAPELRAGPFDQRTIEAREDVVTFTSSPLADPLEVTGPIRVVLWASSDAPDTDFVARVCDVGPDGRSVNLADGIIRARHVLGRSGNGTPRLESGRPYRFEIDLWATSNVFLPGHRIRLDVTSSSFPRWDRNLNTAEPWTPGTVPRIAHQRIYHDPRHPSRVILPVIPGGGRGP